MKHVVIRVKNLMYEGCEDHWGCIICSQCVPLHCYKKEQFENMDCEGLKDLTFSVPKGKIQYVSGIRKQMR